MGVSGVGCERGIRERGEGDGSWERELWTGRRSWVLGAGRGERGEGEGRWERELGAVRGS